MVIFVERMTIFLTSSFKRRTVTEIFLIFIEQRYLKREFLFRSFFWKEHCMLLQFDFQLTSVPFTYL